MEEHKTIINSRYRVKSVLGRGGTGMVYLVEDLFRDNTAFALKTLIKDPHGNAESISFQAIRDNFELMTGLKHPNLVQVYDLGIHEDKYYIVMDYLQGMLLKDLIYSRDNPHLVEKLSIIVQIARVLDFLHSRNIIYRDLKPADIIISNSKAVLCDFWLSGLTGKSQDRILYLAPEALKGKADFSSDFFSLGLVFYEMICRRQFYLSGDSADSSFITGVMKSRDNFNLHLDKSLSLVDDQPTARLVRKMLCFSEKERYASGNELIQDINQEFNTSFDKETFQTRQSYTLACAFADRDKDLALLKSKLSPDTGPCLFICSGPSGIGKSRLFGEFKKHCRLNNMGFYEALAYSGNLQEYFCIGEILAQMISDAGRSLLKKYAPLLRHIIPDHPVLTDYHPLGLDDPKVLREIILDSVPGFILDFSRSMPFKPVLCIINIQWIDEGSARILNSLLNRIESRTEQENNPLILAGLLEEQGQHIGAPAEILLKNRPQRHTLEPFDDDGIGEFLDRVFGRLYIGSSLREYAFQIREMTGGSPIFLLEFIRALLDKEYIIREKGVWILKTPVNEAFIPSNLSGIMEKRMEKILADKDKACVLKTLSLLRVELPFELIIKLTERLYGINPSEIITELETFEILVCRLKQNTVYCGFSNSLIKTAVEKAIDDKKGMNRLIGEYMETMQDKYRDYYLEETAYHFRQAGDAAKALKYYLKCAVTSRESYFHERALRLYDTSLDLVPGDDKQARMDILLEKCISLEALGMWDSAEDILGHIRETAKKNGWKTILGRACNVHGRMSLRQGDYKRARELFDSALDIFSGHEISSDYARTLYNLGMYFSDQSHLSEAIDYYELYRELCIKLNDRNGYCESLNDIGNVYYLMSDYDKALEYFESYREISSKTGAVRNHSIALGNIGNIHYIRGDYEKALKYYRQYGKLALDIGDRREYKIAMGNLGNVFYVLGKLDEALHHYTVSYDISREIGDKRGCANALGNLGNIYSYRNNYQKALEYYEKLRDLSEQTGYKTGYAFAIASIGSICHSQGNFEKALENFEESVNLYQEINDRMRFGFSLTSMGYVYYDQGKFQKALECFEIHRNLAREIGDTRALGISQGNMGSVFYIQKEYDRALEFINQAVQTFTDLKLDDSLCRYINLKTNILLRLGNTELAGEINAMAIKIASRLETSEEFIKAEIEKNKLLSRNDPVSAEKGLESLLHECRDDELKAEIYYQLWKISGKDSYRQESFNLYKELYSNVPKYEYRLRISEF